MTKEELIAENIKLKNELKKIIIEPPFKKGQHVYVIQYGNVGSSGADGLHASSGRTVWGYWARRCEIESIDIRYNQFGSNETQYYYGFKGVQEISKDVYATMQEANDFIRSKYEAERDKKIDSINKEYEYLLQVLKSDEYYDKKENDN